MLQQRMKRKNLTRVTTFAVGDFLREHCHKGEDGFAYYDPPWNDQTIVEQFPKMFPGHEEVTPHHVKHIRLDIIGELYAARGGGPGSVAKRMAELESEIADHRSRLEALEAWAAARPVAPFKSTVAKLMEKTIGRPEPV